MYDQEKEALKQRLQKAESICLTTDCWTSMTIKGYMTVTAHYINDDWNFCSSVLDTCTSPVGNLEDNDYGPQCYMYTAEALAAQLGTVEESWAIEQKIICVVHDNSSDVKNIARDSLGAEDVGCTAHTLQLAINKGFTSSAAIQTLIGACSRLVNYFKKSTVATKALHAAQKAQNVDQRFLKSSCKTRWNSTFEMMQRLEEFRWPVCSVLSNPDYTTLTDARVLGLKNNQWALMSALGVCLKVLKYGCWWC